MTLRIGLGETASTALDQQTRNHQSLGSQNGCNRDCLPAILIPEGRRAKAYLAVFRQFALIDTKALELATVENRPGETALGDWDVRRLLPVENAQYQVSCMRADQTGANNKASGAAESNRGFCVDNDGPVRGL